MPPGTASAQTIDPQSPIRMWKSLFGTAQALAKLPSSRIVAHLQRSPTLGRNHDRIRSDSKVRNFTDGAPGRIGRRNWRCRAAMEFFRYCRLTSPKPLLRNRATTSSVLKRFVNGAEGEAFIRRSVSRAPTINPCHATAALASWPAVPGFPDPRTRPNAFTSRFPRERWFQAAPARAYCRSAIIPRRPGVCPTNSTTSSHRGYAIRCPAALSDVLQGNRPAETVHRRLPGGECDRIVPVVSEPSTDQQSPTGSIVGRLAHPLTG
jgi:hypothetical protein